MRRLPWRSRREGAAFGGAAVRYAVLWLAAAAAVTFLVSIAGGGGGDDSVSVPPVRETELRQAAVRGRCVLRTATAGERLNPPVEGPAGARPAPAAVYDKPVAEHSLVAAVRRGIVVIQFRPGLSGDDVDALKSLQQAVPKGTIVAPNGTGMHFDVAVVAYRRLLGCPRFTDTALDAVQLFRGRFLGSGPD
jgi:hypothetical protein